MKFLCITLIFAISVMKSWEAVDRREVLLGNVVMLYCTISYHLDITWMRHSPGQIPIVVLETKRVTDRTVFYYHQHNHRFTGVIIKQSIALKIENITDSDFALYYCAGKESKILQFGNGTQLLEFTNPGPGIQPVTKDYTDGERAPAASNVSGAMHVYPLFATLLGCGQLGMICAVVTVHLKSQCQHSD